MKANLMLNGDVPSKRIIEKISKDYTLCADGALNWCRENGIKVNFYVGDRDSVTGKIDDVDRIVFDKEKNETDGELALLHLITNQYDDITIYGAIGGREDHMFANFGLLLKAFNLGIKCKIVTENFDITLHSKIAEFEIKIGDTFSFAPFCDSVHIIRITGAQYDAKDLRLDLFSARGISNVAVEEKVKIQAKSGKFLLFIPN